MKNIIDFGVSPEFKSCFFGLVVIDPTFQPI